MNERQRKEIQIFNEALELTSVAERADYLSRACGNDEVLRQKVDALLQIQAEADGFFGTVTSDGNRAMLSAVARSSGSSDPDSASGSMEIPGTMIGRYKLLQKIGEGGCGVVYMAEQEEPVRRRVALKVIKLGMDTKSVIARFEAERQALALMDHPNIAKVHDAGAMETGRPYFVMELVRGVKITDYCDQKNLSTKERLDLFIRVCQAIQHAHQKGIIHRDIKPSNILVTLNDGVAVPKVIDFGIAKATTDQRLTNKTVFTAFEQFIGTPAYMSPEQAELTGVDIDTRSDIYSLGVLLYELLTGKTPFDAAELLKIGLDEMRRTIREREPERPSTRVSTLGGNELTATAKRRGLDAPKFVNILRGDIDWIVMKCLEKKRARRYETANGLAMDIQRYLSSEPVVACPPTAMYRLQKFIRRNQVMVAAGAVFIMVLVLGIVISSWQALRAIRAEHEQQRLRLQAQTNEDKAKAEAVKSQQVAQFLKDMLEGVGPSKALGRDTTMLGEILDKTAARVGKELTNAPDAQTELMRVLARTYADLGLYKQAEEMARENLRLARTQFGEESVAVAQAFLELGETCLNLGNFEQAETSILKAVEGFRKVQGNESPDVAASLDALSATLSDQGKYAQATAMAREALQMRRKLLGSDHHDTVLSLNNLAFALQHDRQFAEAENLSREALASLKKLLGDEHPEVAICLDNLGLILYVQGKWAQAESAHREAAAMRRKLLGNDHPELAISLHNLAVALQKQGKLAEAETSVREALRIERKRLGPEHPDVAFCLDTLALVLKREGNLAEAEATVREALAKRRELLSDDHPRVANSLNRLAQVLELQGKLAEAEGMHRDALRIMRKALGNENLDVAVSLGNLSFNLQLQGKWEEAEAMCREALAIRRKLTGSGHPDTIAELNSLSGILQREGKFDEAESLVRGQLLELRSQRSPDDPDLAGVLAQLASTLITENKFAEAEQAASECLAIREKKLPDDWLTFHTRSLLGASLLGQHKYAEAEPLLLSGYEGIRQQKDKVRGQGGAPRLKEALERLVQLYEATARPQQAAEWKKRLEELDNTAGLPRSAKAKEANK